jgi:DNA mismatch repair protein MutS
MFVPCDTFELRPYRTLFTRVGLRDDLSRGHSTFMVEMLELRNIMRRCDARSLVIGDELCAGTEAASALAIVGAAVVHLHARGASFLLATHLHELPDLPQVRALAPPVRVCHLRVRCADGEREGGLLVYDRVLSEGRGPSLYGLEVCRALDMDAGFLRAANAIRRDLLAVEPELVSGRRSRYNARLLVDRCAGCGGRADQTHHLRHQAEADADGFVGHFHKDRLFNLAPLCERCHEAVHRGELELGGYAWTSEGARLGPL